MEVIRHLLVLLLLPVTALDAAPTLRPRLSAERRPALLRLRGGYVRAEGTFPGSTMRSQEDPFRPTPRPQERRQESLKIIQVR